MSRLRILLLGYALAFTASAVAGIPASTKAMAEQALVPLEARVDTGPLPLTTRVEVLESVWRQREVIFDDNAVLHRYHIFRFLDRRTDFDQLLSVRVREALGFDTVGGVQLPASVRAWGAVSLDTIRGGRLLLDSRISYGPTEHHERYWLSPSPGRASPWTVDSITIGRWVWY